MLQDSLLQRRRPSGGDGNLIPLINIVFLLLIFFMVAGQITAITGAEVQPPESSSDKPLVLPPITLVLDSDNNLTIDGRAVTLNTLADELAARQSPAAATNIAVKADQEATAAQLDAVLSVLRELGLGKVTLFSRAREGQ